MHSRYDRKGVVSHRTRKVVVCLNFNTNKGVARTWSNRWIGFHRLPSEEIVFDTPQAEIPKYVDDAIFRACTIYGF